jgi:hypothetical protein
MEITPYYISDSLNAKLRLANTDFESVFEMIIEPPTRGESCGAYLNFEIRDESLPEMKISLVVDQHNKSISMELWDDPEEDHALASRDITFEAMKDILKGGDVEKDEIDENTLRRLE